MHDVCKARMDEHGFTDRVTMHQCKLDAYTGDPQSYDAATALLVAHFLPRDLARAFYGQIRNLLKPGGLCFSADVSKPDNQDFESVLDLWVAHGHSQGGPEIRDMVVSFRKAFDDTTPRTQSDTVAMMGEAGLEGITVVFRSLIYAASCSKAPAARAS